MNIIGLLYVRPLRWYLTSQRNALRFTRVVVAISVGFLLLAIITEPEHFWTFLLPGFLVLVYGSLVSEGATHYDKHPDSRFHSWIDG